MIKVFGQNQGFKLNFLAGKPVFIMFPQIQFIDKKKFTVLCLLKDHNQIMFKKKIVCLCFFQPQSELFLIFYVFSFGYNRNQYWTKSYRSEYVPAFTLNDTNLNYYTKNFLRNDRTSSSLNGENNLLLQKVLDLLRKFVSTLDGCYFIAIVFMAAFVIMFFKHK